MTEAPRVLVLGTGLVVAALVSLGTGVAATPIAQVTGDEPQYLMSALSLWEEQNLDISDERSERQYLPFHPVEPQAQSRVLDDGRRLSPHDPLLPLLLALPMGLGGWVAAKLAIALGAGALAAVLVWVAVTRLSIPPLHAAAVVGVFSLSPPLAVYATQVYPELLAGLVVTGAIAALLGSPTRLKVTIVVAAVVILPWLSVKYAVVAAVLGLALLGDRRQPVRRAWVLGAFTFGAAAYVVGHLWLYGGLTPYAVGDHFVGGELTVVGRDPDYWGRSERILGLMVDREFGLAAWQPAYLLVPAAMAWGLRQRVDGVGVLAAVAGAGWLMATFVAPTMHGWWFPGRQLVVVLPAVVLLVAAWVGRLRGRLAWVVGLGSLGVVAFGWLVAEGLAGRVSWVIDFMGTSYPWYHLASPLLPTYQEPSAVTWALHGAWAAALAVIAWIGWRAPVGVPGKER